MSSTVDTEESSPLHDEETAVSSQSNLFLTAHWARRATQTVLIALMVTTLITAVMLLFDAGTGRRFWFRLVPFILFVTVEGILTTFWLNHPDRRLVDNTAYRLAELVMLAFIMRLYTWLILEGGFPPFAEWRTFFFEPSLIFNGIFFVGLFLLVLAWQRAIAFTNIFNDLALSESEKHFYSLSSSEQRFQADDRPIQKPRRELVYSFLIQFLWGGIVLVVCTALSTFDLTEISAETRSFRSITQLALPPYSLLSLIFYFLAGFWLLSQAQLAVLQVRWLADGMKQEETVEQRWRSVSTWLLLAIAVIAAFVPIGSGAPIGRILGVILGYLLYVVQFIFFLISLLFFSLLSLILSNTEGSENTDASPPPPPQPPPPPAESVPPNETIGLIANSLTWTLIIVGIIIALAFFLRERGFRFDTTLPRQLWAAISLWVRTQWALLTQRVESAQLAIRSRLPALSQAEAEEKGQSRSPWRFVRINGLSPREQVRYFYLSTVRRASEQGVERQASETPNEYLQQLQQGWPEADEESEELTAAFLKARYSPDNIEKNEAQTVKARWQQVRRSLRRRKQHDDKHEE